MYACVSIDKFRFLNEVRRCHEKKIKLYVLIEHGGRIKNLEDVRAWTPKYGYIKGEEIYRRMVRLNLMYGVEFVFCDKRCTARRIIEILTKEHLQDMEV